MTSRLFGNRSSEYPHLHTHAELELTTEDGRFAGQLTSKRGKLQCSAATDDDKAEESDIASNISPSDENFSHIFLYRSPICEILTFLRKKDHIEFVPYHLNFVIPLFGRVFTMSTSFNIVVFGGDHCGPEVAAEGIKILKAIESVRPELKFNFQEHLLGGCSIDAHGTAITDEALEAAKNADAILLGAIGGPVRISLDTNRIESLLTHIEMGYW
jgi:hypothetical protein